MSWSQAGLLWFVIWFSLCDSQQLITYGWVVRICDFYTLWVCSQINTPSLLSMFTSLQSSSQLTQYKWLNSVISLFTGSFRNTTLTHYLLTPCRVHSIYKFNLSRTERTKEERPPISHEQSPEIEPQSIKAQFKIEKMVISEDLMCFWYLCVARMVFCKLFNISTISPLNIYNSNRFHNTRLYLLLQVGQIFYAL